MKHHSERTLSIWMDTAKRPAFPALAKNEQADVCIVGAGIAGLTTAYLLAKAGKNVVVLEKEMILGGETEHTTAHVSYVTDDRFAKMEKLLGLEKAKIAVDSHFAAIDCIERIVKEEKIDCDFERLDGYLFVPPGESTKIIDDELAAAKRMGYKDIEKTTSVKLGSKDVGPALRCPDQAQFHPLKYCIALAECIKAMGGQIYAQTRVTNVKGGKDAHVETESGLTVKAKNIVVATMAPINDNPLIFSKQSPYRSYVICVKVPKGSVKNALFWDTEDPYHYVRLHGDDYVIVGGEDHKTAHANDAEKRFKTLESWTRERVPNMGEVVYRWSGQVCETVDRLAMIGRNPLDHDNVFIATGDSGLGMTHGTIAGMLLTDVILGYKKNPWEKLYSPSRFRLKTAKNFAEENADNMACFFGDRLKKSDVKNEKDIKPGTGAVMSKGLKRIAIYRDEKGACHRLSATCTHAGCIVHWNDLEKSWDCPCHGSRFATDGKVLTGPAKKPLKKA